MGISSTVIFSMDRWSGSGVQTWRWCGYSQLGLDECAQVAGRAVFHGKDQVQVVVVFNDHPGRIWVAGIAMS